MTENAAAKRRISLKTWLCILISAVFVLSLIPVGLVAQYDYPLGDDRVYGDAAAEAYRETGSVCAAIRAASDVVAYKFRSWQGTYSAMFLMALHPAVFGVSHYSITPFLMLGALILSTLFLSYVVLRRCLNTDRRTWWILSVTTLFFSIQLLPSAMEGFFWFNGASYYTLFHSMFLTMAAVLLLAWRSESKAVKMILGGIASVLAVILAGGNYATLLPCGVLLFFAAVYFFVLKKDWENGALSVIVLVLLAAGMAVSVLAPGNAVRQAEVNELYTPSGPVQSVLLSFALALAAVVNRFDTAAILIIVLAALLVTPYAKKSAYSFRYPLIAVLLAFCVFATQFTPTLYAATSPGPYRLRNIIFFNFYWMIAFDTVYLCGWAMRKRERRAASEADNPLQQLNRFFGSKPLIAILAVALFTGSALLQRDFLHTTTVSAAMELYTGTAASHGARRLSQYTGEPLPATEAGDDEDRVSVLLP